MGLERYPYVALHGRIHSQRPIGSPRKRWIDNIKEDCTELGMSLVDATHHAVDRGHWRNIAHNTGCWRASTTSQGINQPNRVTISANNRPRCVVFGRRPSILRQSTFNTRFRGQNTDCEHWSILCPHSTRLTTLAIKLRRYSCIWYDHSIHAGIQHIAYALFASQGDIIVSQLVERVNKLPVYYSIT